MRRADPSQASSTRSSTCSKPCRAAVVRIRHDRGCRAPARSRISSCSLRAMRCGQRICAAATRLSQSIARIRSKRSKSSSPTRRGAQAGEVVAARRRAGAGARWSGGSPRMPAHACRPTRPAPRRPGRPARSWCAQARPRPSASGRCCPCRRTARAGSVMRALPGSARYVVPTRRRPARAAAQLVAHRAAFSNSRLRACSSICFSSRLMRLPRSFSLSASTSAASCAAFRSSFAPSCAL